MGDTGAAGPNANNGNTGGTGPKGAKGDIGAKGSSGSAGNNGGTGPKGAKGDTGVSGQKGGIGDLGPKGSQGGQGDKGNTGPQGDIGYLSVNNIADGSGPADQDGNMLDYSTWTIGNSSASGFGRNGGTNENIIEYGEGPYGEQAILWRTIPDGNGNNADGGWNSSFHNVDHTKKYRISVWMKRISDQSNGTFYLGTNGGGACVLEQNGSTQECNPYFECRGVGGFTKDVWYLHVGHVFPSGSTNVGRDSQTGVFTLDGGYQFQTNGCNLGGDAVMQTTTTSLRHRTYHYYANSSGTELVFAYPRLEEVGSSTPDIINGYLSGAFTNTGIKGQKGQGGDGGATGATGSKGQKGEIGPGGPKGPQGDQGPKGPTGDQGPIGPQGSTGAEGGLGFQGAQGAQGGQGPAGLQGPQGLQGNQGPQGAQGGQGPQGKVGPKGVTGGGGAQGPKGNRGPTGGQGGGGSTGPIGGQGGGGSTGPTGGQGGGGAQGPTGGQGGGGATGPIGGQGGGGAQGPIGGQGGGGAQGPTGGQGGGGATGPQGPQGEQGLSGAKGNTGGGGAQGSQGGQGGGGAQGPQGRTGNQGPQGDTGPQGPSQKAAAGAKGQKGEARVLSKSEHITYMGPRGATGGTGAKGQKGQRGNFGPTGPPGGQGNECLPYGTPIKMADGTYKNVEDLVVGDSVQAYNIDGLGTDENWYGWSTTSFNGTAMTAQVVNNKLGSYGVYYLVNNTLKATEEHAILIKRAGTTSFEAVRDVVVGDQMLNESYQWIDITSIEKVYEPVWVANPDVEDVDNYFASGFLVHNPKDDLDKPEEEEGRRSDERLKAVQGSITSALAKVKQMESYYFYSNDLADRFGYDRVAEGEQKPRRIGLIAQELMAIEPNLVEVLHHLPTDEGQDGYYTINYEHLNALLIEAMKELEARAAIAETQAGL